MTAPVLVVQHEPECPPGLVGAWLTDAGLALDVVHPYAGEPLPVDLTDHAGLVVLGGHMGANDDATTPWLAPTKALLRSAAAAGVPALGICLGHQLAAVALGGEVRVNPEGVRRGVLDLGWLPAAGHDPVVSGCGPRAVLWHHDIVTRTPDGTEELARSSTGDLTAARFAPTVWGVQCHPEADATIVAGWAARGRAEAGDDEGEGARIDAALATVEAGAEELRAAWRPLARAFATQVLERGGRDGDAQRDGAERVAESA